MPSYSLYGLKLRANQALPRLTELPMDGPEDLWIGLQVRPPWLHQEMTAETWYVSENSGEQGPPRLLIKSLNDGSFYQLRYADGTEFFVNCQATQMWATWPESATIEDTAVYLLGPVMGFLLLLRGINCLHACAIRVGAQAIALVGPSGAGKSTTAAAFAKTGYAILSEDVVTLAEQQADFWVHPAYPCIRLWPASVEFLYGEAEALPRLTPNWDKLHLDLTSDGYRHHAEPLPLGAIYLLDERQADPAAPFIEALPPAAAQLALIGNTYAAVLLDKRMRAREFEQLGRVLARVPVRRVIPHTDPARLPELCAAILADFQRLPVAREDTRN